MATSSRRSNSARTPGCSRSSSMAYVGVPGDVAVADQHRDVGGQPLGAQRRRRERRRHREEDDRAPRRVARIAPPSQPGTSTQTTVTSAGPPTAATTASRRAIGSRASATTTSSARPDSRRRAASSSLGTTPTVRRAPALRAAARLSEPDLPAPPMTATTPCSYCATTRCGQGRGAAHVHHRQAEVGGQVVGEPRRRSSGRTGRRSRRTAPARSGRPSGPGRPRSPAG